MEKWNEMVKNFDKYYAENFTKLKERIRKGIPDCFRGYVWQYLGGVQKYLLNEANKGLFNRLLNEENNGTSLEDENLILRDIDRTFPKHTFFKDKYGLGQRSLFNVLRAFAKFNIKTGYVQGMGFISALFLTYMDEECSYWLLHSLMTKYEMEGFFLPKFPELQRSFYKFLCLLKEHLPKVYEHLADKKRNISPSMYASQWFITLFSINFKFEILVRVFDVFLSEGIKIIYRFGLALFKIHEQRILGAKQLEEVMAVFKTFYENQNIDDLFSKAFGFSISRSDLAEYEKKYDQIISGNAQDDDIISLIR